MEAIMKITATQYAMTVGLAGVLILSAPASSIAKMQKEAEHARPLAQYCVPEDNQDAHKPYCRNWQLIPMGS
jgi:hypothetical protein